MFQVFLGVSYVYLRVFHLDVAYVCNGFHIFLRHFRKCFRHSFKRFICFLLYVATVVSVCLKNRSGVAHEMCVESGCMGDVSGSTGPLLARFS
jgi:hypothetical protein